MPRFNQKSTQTLTATRNYAGGEAFQESPELELASMLLTSFATDQYYRTGSDGVARLVALTGRVRDPRFAAKAAIYARNEFGMRTVTHVLAAEIAKTVKGEQWTKHFYDRVIRRPDDATEIAAYYLAKYGKPLPNSLKRGLGLALAKFDGYQLAKYRASDASVKLVDLVNLAHPKPVERNAEALQKLVADELRAAETWEAKLTRAGQAAEGDEEKLELKREAWAELIRERKIAYFALLRNLRNLMEQAPDEVDAALALLVDERLIRQSLVLPFRFGTAYRELQQVAGSAPVLTAVAKAAEIALANVPLLDGRTLVALDVSGSMQGRPFEIGAMFAAILARKNGADLLVFSQDAKYHNLPADADLFGMIGSLREAATWGGTNFHAIFETAAKPYDRIVILSDMQGWIGDRAPTGPFASYRKKFGVAPKLFSFDLQGYGTLQFPEKDVFALAGFSDRVFEVMRLLEGDPKALIRIIEAVEL
jgi:hypothetical protein